MRESKQELERELGRKQEVGGRGVVEGTGGGREGGRHEEGSGTALAFGIIIFSG